MTYALMNEFDRTFDSLWNQNFTSARTLTPKTEISESENAFFISLDVPGMKKDGIKIEVKEQRMTVSGERKRTLHDRRSDVQEKSYGFFERSFNLPETANGDQIEARFEDGVLEIVIPKKEETKPRRVEIQTGEATGLFSKLLDAVKTPVQE